MSDLAIWMAGYVSVPLYPTLAAETITQILTHSEARFIFIGKLDGWEGMKPGVIPSLPGASYALSPDDVKQNYESWDAICARTEPLKGEVTRGGRRAVHADLHLGHDGQPQGRDAQLRRLHLGHQRGPAALPDERQRPHAVLPAAGPRGRARARRAWRG